MTNKNIYSMLFKKENLLPGDPALKTGHIFSSEIYFYFQIQNLNLKIIFYKQLTLEYMRQDLFTKKKRDSLSHYCLKIPTALKCKNYLKAFFIFNAAASSCSFVGFSFGLLKLMSFITFNGIK